MIVEHTDPYYTVICDNCGEGVGSDDYGGNIICGSRAEAESLARDWEWRITESVITCAGCLGDEPDPVSASSVESQTPPPEHEQVEAGKQEKETGDESEIRRSGGAS